jgi:hypothetical protein
MLNIGFANKNDSSETREHNSNGRDVIIAVRAEMLFQEQLAVAFS